FCDLSNGAVDVDVTAAATWTSNATDIVPHPVAGLVQGMSEGTATIRATVINPDSTSTTKTHPITVTTGELIAVRVEYDDSEIPAGRTKPFIAYCDYTDRTDVLCTLDVKWSSSRTDVATIDSLGVATTHISGGQPLLRRCDGLHVAVPRRPVDL
ncbi:MAG: hypothetical protein JXX14_10110, partial [Deltaproteobacteria bacterium]|nr:hypothetical protein [Deltaproteobacteria bacterium]